MTGTNYGKGAPCAIKEGKGSKIRFGDKQQFDAQFDAIITGGNATHWQWSICTSVEVVRKLVVIKKLSTYDCQLETLETRKSIAPRDSKIDALKNFIRIWHKTMHGTQKT